MHLNMHNIDCKSFIKYLGIYLDEHLQWEPQIQHVNNKLAKNVGIISNGNRTEWSPIQSVIIRVITKSDDRAAAVRFVYHEYDYRLNWTTRSPIIN